MLIRTQPIDIQVAWRRLLAQQIGGMRLSPTQIERFNAASAPDRFRHFLISGVSALVLFNLFLVSDWYMVRDVFDLAVTVRLYMLTPAVLLLLLTGYVLWDWWLAHTPPWLTEALGMVGTMAVSASLGVVMLETHSEQLSMYRGGLVPILVFGNLVQRLRFRFALASTLFNVGVCVFTMIVRQDLPRPYEVIEVPLALLLMLVALYTLICNFNLELDERQRFLQTERAQALRSELEQSHRSLDEMSNLDPLTGLANRRRFDAYLAKEMPGVNATDTALALMLIDVDHFKAFNDRYGHPAGDQCLRHIAQTLKEAMPQQEGLLARWGGEEFAIVLPGANRQDALAAAESLRRAVEALRMRHEASPTAGHVTISVGVAMLSQDGGQDAVRQLLARADQALYQSKQGGRNRCTL
ncbi:MAG TPA: diguanylate cyclase [Aquabacterium sp.]|uniref:GGDEF domain-containing protein n=1 Tax=Aquabacterium sp. TaxID=1872578 RepID=UPI002E373F63|nr:diguanylate cyclase [Aquabacterium sp.]HEX5357971.1 diguanylate cyclase [Aquabacterium sp.]